jgi:hypothetical protein
MYLAVWLMDYLINTIDTPLVLGGPVADPEVTSDASFATMSDRTSVIGHAATTGPESGAIYASCTCTKSAVTSIWDAELVSSCSATKTAAYMSSSCDEMMYDVPTVRKLKCDNTAVIDWGRSETSNKRSRHIAVQYYYLRHAERDGIISMEYIQSKENMADILTKSFPVAEFRRLASYILGHRLVKGLSIPGVIETAEYENK